jgi:NADH:ubiquinone oxidoreductase subunit 2 (subunit N)
MPRRMRQPSQAGTLKKLVEAKYISPAIGMIKRAATAANTMMMINLELMGFPPFIVFAAVCPKPYA